MQNDPSLDSSPTVPGARGRSVHFPGRAQWLVGALVLGMLAVVSIPAWSQTSGRAGRVKSLAQAKQIGLSLKLYASDNEGVFPQSGTPAELKKPTTSNAVFAVLFPTYCTSERIFGDAASAYQTRKPDDVIDDAYTGTPVKTLAPGENVYAYVMGLKDTDNAACPLIVDGTDGTGHYLADATKPGGVGSNGEVVVIRLDDSGALEHLSGPPTALYVPLGKVLAEAFGGKPDGNLLDAKLYGKDVRLLDPAIDLAKGH